MQAIQLQQQHKNTHKHIQVNESGFRGGQLFDPQRVEKCHRGVEAAADGLVTINNFFKYQQVRLKKKKKQLATLGRQAVVCTQLD